MDLTKKWAIIDIGSNTIRLVIYKENNSGILKETNNIKSPARLRRYLNEDNVLMEKGIKKLIEILTGFKEILAYHEVENVQCVATATIRQAVNKERILKNVKEQTGLTIEIFTEEEEAYYGFYAVTQTTPIAEGVTIDIGGGSTEITYYKDRKLKHFHSFPFGVVSLKEQYIKGDTVTEEERETLSQFIIHSLQSLPWLKDLHVPIVAIGGSARNIAQMDQHLKKYPLAGIHQYTMNINDLYGIRSYMESLNFSELERLEGLSKDRADIIFPALEVFIHLCEYVQSKAFMFSRKGLRDGVFLKKFGEKLILTNTEEIISRSINQLRQDYDIDEEHSNHVAFLAGRLYKEVIALCNRNESLEHLKIIDRSARVYFIGEYMDADISSQHTFYLLANQSIDGLDHKERLKLAMVSSFKNKTLLRQYIEPFLDWFTKEELEEIRIGGALTKLASSLDASKRGIVKDVKLSFEENGDVTLTVLCTGNFFVERYQVEKQIRHLEKAIKQSILIKFILSP
ncbi:Ppx/GppA family phosphatase [Bacillus sp. 31A1R]|uniref:Ppx/GppA family phosphatase n=1 Tax=Robertmurraya mangrovi TaxID=3098077 RepID=A0ABU5ITX6_9BACI|nr:Ppx/GppA family phosphatase [Bacillus sp. 31A1R]MDZ5470591.1 Ppx/GppA family phosphatase [Bacillus sp. 31A1R]